MEPVSTHSFVRESARQTKFLCNLRLRSMEGSIETRHLGH